MLSLGQNDSQPSRLTVRPRSATCKRCQPYIIRHESRTKDAHAFSSRHPAAPPLCCAGSRVPTFFRLFVMLFKQDVYSCCVLGGIFKLSQSIMDKDVAVDWPSWLVSFSAFCNEGQCGVNRVPHEKASRSPPNHALSPRPPLPLSRFLRISFCRH